MPKQKGTYGTPGNNNIGVFRGSAISALLFIIYLDDMMEDYEALNIHKRITLKHTHTNAQKQT